MTTWLRRVLAQIHAQAAAGRVRFTLKALRELAALDVGLDEADARDVLASLSGADAAGRFRSKLSGEWLYVFKPVVAGASIYLKVIVRAHCIVVSFHEDEGGDDEIDDQAS